MFRPDPNGPNSIDEVIVKLTAALDAAPADSAERQKLAEMIGGLQKMKANSRSRTEPRAATAA